MDEKHPDKLRELASWYREFAERSRNPVIWEGRLRTAEDLDAEAERIERSLAGKSRATAPPSSVSRRFAELERSIREAARTMSRPD
jgi:hypothetical protein